MKLIPFLFKPAEPTLSSSSWPWPYCRNPKTLSFRDKTIMQSVYIDAESNFTDSSVYGLSEGTTEQEEDQFSSEGLDESIENVIRGARSSTERLFFDNQVGEATSCVLGDHHQLAKPNDDNDVISKNDCVTSNETKVVLMEMDSRDPLEDFKKSMEEVVEASGFNINENWDSLHQLLSWYLEFNCKTNHVYVIGAFIDLLVSLEFSSASISSPTISSSCENEQTSSFDSPSEPVTSESPNLSFTSNCSTGPCLLTPTEEEEDDDDAGLDRCFTHHQE
ncbi:hypothetical protein AgCh_005008 [Apium graveolens]